MSSTLPELRIWVRNGLQIKGQAMTYIQANFCNSMVDMDLFFLQIFATQLPASFFLSSCVESFGVDEWFFGNLTSPQEMEHDSMMEGMLTFLATLVTSRTNLGNDEDMKCIVEISALLATSDKTHSQLLELMPERSGNAYARNFEKYLKQLSTYRPPPVGSENLEQGLFIPLPAVWKIHYDPLHVLLRAVHRRDFQNSMDRFSAYVRQHHKMPKSGNLWPPFRLPNKVNSKYTDPVCILNTKVFHSMILGILYRAVHVTNVSEHLIALGIFLLEIAVTSVAEEKEKEKEKFSHRSTVLERSPRSGGFHSSSDGGVHEKTREIPVLMNCYPTNNLMENLCLSINAISLNSPALQNSPANYQSQFDSDVEFELSEGDTMPMLIGSLEHDFSAYNVVFDVAVPQDLSIVRETSVVSAIMDENSSAMSGTAATPGTTVIATNQIMPPLVGRAGESVDQSVVEYRSNEVATTQRPQLAIASGNVSMELAVRQVGEATTGAADGVRPQEIFYSTNGSDTLPTSILVPFNRVQPVAVPNRSNMDIVPSAGGSSNFRRRRKNMDVTGGSSSSGGELSNDIIAIANSDEMCAKNINEIRQKLWPNQRERQAEQKARENKEKEERTKRARERQQKLMEEFAFRQKQFMASEGKMMEGIDDDEIDEEEAPREKEYDCIICNCTGPSLETNPIGLVVLVESSSIVGHRRKTSNRFPLPVCDEDKEIPERNVRLSNEFKKRAEILHRKYGTQWFLTQNICWEGGVHVQSCGHHVHLTCYESYLKSLGPMRSQNLNIEHGEFSCPVCRQLANSVLPLSPQLDRPTTIIRNPTPNYGQLCVELMELIKDTKRSTATSKLEEAMIRAMESMSNSTRNIKKYHAEALYQNPPTSESLFSFVTSVARTNLESEVIQRGGSLCTFNDVRYRPKRECIVPLLHVLAFHVRLMINNKNVHFGHYEWKMDRAWATLCGIPLNDNDDAPVPSYSCNNENFTIPSLITDPCAQLIKFILLAPLQLDQAYFTCIVKVMYNLMYYQIVLQFCSRLTDEQCEETVAKFSNTSNIDENGVDGLGSAMALVLNNLDNCKDFRQDLFENDCSSYEMNDHDDVDMNEGEHFDITESSSNTSKETEKTWNIDEMLIKFEKELESLCLPYLRNAALLRHHIYRQELPEVRDSEYEFARLVYFLELVTKSMDWKDFHAAKALYFAEGTELSLPIHWCKVLKESRPPYDTTRELIMNQHIVWHQPQLLALPREYERLFTYYYEQACLKCSSIPKESSICLICGKIVCLKQTCCKEQDCCEAVRHAITCGRGTGVFLVVTSTFIIIVRGSRACLWGSLYLDGYDEEDRDLKRGKPLYLSNDRFNLLESQWQSHRFGHINRSWVFHRDSL
ncbi:CLUMA_CG006257, isoform A [Clunio marinus]|uniref:E3 ubiquitin-protein ligase n=1 Tax=Clunio marinus TaxID=568069 RepID=A0A1J1HXV0_9DIPT|nr:CLUMA_CG006257, isoform A [Clunio marinus]